MEQLSIRGAASRPGRAHFGRWLLSALIGLDQRYRQRRALENLDPHIRRDIGLPEIERRRWTPPHAMMR